jgi:hypothetical protein
MTDTPDRHLENLSPSNKKKKGISDINEQFINEESDNTHLSDSDFCS